jgi:hypothetical protein
MPVEPVDLNFLGEQVKSLHADMRVLRTESAQTRV